MMKRKLVLVLASAFALCACSTATPPAAQPDLGAKATQTVAANEAATSSPSARAQTTSALQDLRTDLRKTDKRAAALSGKTAKLEKRVKTLSGKAARLERRTAAATGKALALQKRVTGLEKANAQLKTSLAQASAHGKAYERQVERLEAQNATLQKRVQASELAAQANAARIKALEAQAQKADASALEAQLATLTYYAKWGGAVLALLLLAFVALLLRSIAVRRELSKLALADAKRERELAQLNERTLGADATLLNALEKALDAGAAKASAPSGGEPDHGFALKVCDEVVRMELNVARMAPDTKGLKQISRSLSRIKDNLLANGYEIVELLGKPYNDGMKLVADFVADDELEEGAQVITGITKPQVNYNGKMIQAAQVTVSQNI